MRETNYSYQMEERSDIVITSNSAFFLPIKINSIYQWRILGLVMLKMQADFGDHHFDFRTGKDLKNQKPFLDEIRLQKLQVFSPIAPIETLYKVRFPLNFLLSRDISNKLKGYDCAKRALYSLSRPYEYENKKLKKSIGDKKCKINGVIWGLYHVIEEPKIIKENGEEFVCFHIPERTWDVLCQWEKGVHIFEMSVFFHFERPASVPFYIFLADYRKKGQIVWSTSYLKDLLAPGEYRDYSGFKKKVLEPVAEDLKEHSPFYIEIKEYVDAECTIPAKKGRWHPANFIKIDIHHQPGKNLAVDERIDLFLEMNKLSSFHIEDLTKEELNFLSNNLGFKEIKGKNLETIVKLKYYKNYGHDAARNNWRTNPGNFFMLYLKRLYDTIMLSDKPVNNIPAYAIASMQEALAGYKPVEKTPEQIQEEKDTPKAIAK